MAITLEAIRAAGGIVHSDGNIFFRDISMLQGLAGAAPAAVAGPAMDVTLDEDQAGLLRDMLGDREAYPEAITVRLMVGDGHSGHGLYVAQAEYQDEGAVLLASLPAPAAPALEAPAAPAVPLNATPEMRAAFRRAYREGGFWADRIDYALDQMLAAAPQAPAAPSADERAAYVEFLAGKFPRTYSKEDAEHWWDNDHVSALTWQAARADAAAPAAPAVDATSDTALLDAMERERIAVIPEFEGPWDAQIFGEDEATLACGSGATPREAITEALASLDARKAHDAAQDKEGGDQ